jgi:hypothetical protein
MRYGFSIALALVVASPALADDGAARTRPIRVLYVGNTDTDRGPSYAAFLGQRGGRHAVSLARPSAFAIVPIRNTSEPAACLVFTRPADSPRPCPRCLADCCTATRSTRTGLSSVHRTRVYSRCVSFPSLFVTLTLIRVADSDGTTR